MRKRTCGRSRLAFVSAARSPLVLFTGWLLLVALSVTVGCTGNSTEEPPEEEGLIEFPVEEGETQEFSSDRVAQ